MNISSRNQSSFAKLRNALNPPLWDNWGLERANDQKIGTYITLTDTLEFNLNEVSLTGHLDIESINKFAEKPAKRPQKIINLKDQIKISTMLTSGTFVAAGLFLGLDYGFDNAIFKKLYVTSIIFCLASTLAWKKSVSRANRLLNQVTEIPLDSFARANPAATKRISDFLNRLRNLDLKIFVRPANGKIRKINQAFWNADNWEMGLVTDLDARKAVALSGSPPSGEIMFLRSELSDKGLLTERRTAHSEMMLSLEKVTTKVEYAFDPSESNPQRRSNSTASESKNIYEELGLPRNTRWCPYLRAIQNSTGLIKKLVKVGDQKIKSNILDKPFIRQINAYRVIQENSQNWKSMRQGNLDPVLEEKLKNKLKAALCPEAPNSEKAEKLLKGFLKPENRPFDMQVSRWGFVPDKYLLEQVALKKQKMKKP